MPYSRSTENFSVCGTFLIALVRKPPEQMTAVVNFA